MDSQAERPRAHGKVSLARTDYHHELPRMSASTGKNVSAIGFLTAIEHAEHGLFGGYLILNTSGRPLEFHCTAPVKANRAQEILYGPTLRPFLFGEQIGQTLLAKAKIAPLLVCTDMEPILAAREFSEVPLLLVLESTNATVEQDRSATLTKTFELGCRRARVLRSHSGDEDVVKDRWQVAHIDSLDLLEPFTRIREALEEAQKTARPASAA